ncbi:MAG TPA: DEAD/DEAH box helicase [Streptosporangiaceae bacterium]|nr:DEAD/DEAH box helicase [Streptosporangiaceae bacterium]
MSALLPSAGDQAASGPGGGAAATATPPRTPATRIIARGKRTGRLAHVEQIAAREGRRVPWPEWVPAEVTGALAAAGVPGPWAHQAAVAEHARAGRDVIISTPAASGKSLGYLLPALTAVLEGGTALYLAPTRALAADQLRAVQALGIPGLRAAVVDGDTPAAAREWARCHASYLLTTPDLLHQHLLPRHARWNGFLGRLRCVIVDECHGYRGVFGSHVAHVLRRLRRVSAHHAAWLAATAANGTATAGNGAAAAGNRTSTARTGTSARTGNGRNGTVTAGNRPGIPSNGAGTPKGPVFLLASATISEPGTCAWLLTGREAAEITWSAAPRGPVTFGMWQPPLTGARGEAGAPVRRSATAEAADLLADLVKRGTPALAFTRSRRGAEAVALAARRSLQQAGAARQAARVAAYRSGYLADDRRMLEEALRSGRLTGVAATTALELGVNFNGLDAVLIAGWPGTRAALWQQAGRAGRAGRDALVVLIARDDPLDTYLVHHPEALLRQPVEATVLDPGNPYVLAPHLRAAAAELPLTGDDLALFGPGSAAVADGLVADGVLRRRGGGLYCTRRGRPAGLRGISSLPVRIVEQGTGRLVGTVDEPSAHLLVHEGAVYPHQGEAYLVTRLDLDEGVALVEPGDPGYVTSARQLTGIEVTAELRRQNWGPAAVHLGEVEVVRQVVSFARRRPETGQVLAEVPLGLPPRTLRTRAVWWTVSGRLRARLARQGVDLAGAAHAAEHTAIGLLPLFAACDRWDIGGVSADLHPATGKLTVFVYDGNEGGAGFAERGYGAARDWLRATTEAITGCECQAGCPSCIQSPKCGNGNHPLSKSGALTLLEAVLTRGDDPPTPPRRGMARGDDPPHPPRGLAKPANATATGCKEGATPAGGESGGRRTVNFAVRNLPASSKAYR